MTIKQQGKAYQENVLQETQETNAYKLARKEESICPECNIEMKFFKVRKTHRYKKESSYYLCSVCGFKHRFRTENEVLRDLGERD